MQVNIPYMDPMGLGTYFFEPFPSIEHANPSVFGPLDHGTCLLFLFPQGKVIMTQTTYWFIMAMNFQQMPKKKSQPILNPSVSGETPPFMMAFWYMFPVDFL